MSTQNPQTLSVVIITYNEELNIARCLESVKDIADEIVVVDSYSTDKTKEICLSYTSKFFVHDFEGHIQQKNYALSLANCDWVLSLDADEALSEALKDSIQKIKNHSEAQAYQFNRLTQYCGRFIQHGGWYPDVSLRLWKRGAGTWKGINPHDYFALNEGIEPKHLKGDLLHYSYTSIQGHLKQIDYFSDIASKALFEKGKRISWIGIVFKTKFRFVYDYVLRRGFLDGKEGFVIAVLSSYAVFVKYAKLKFLYAKKGN
jgi:glycosyltransferase involved in cell wall biosynthesis